MDKPVNKQEYLQECIHKTMKLTQHLKTHACESAKGKVDADPFIVFGGMEMEDENGDMREVAACVSVDKTTNNNSKHPAIRLPKMLSELEIPTELANFQWLCFVTEGYCREEDEQNPLPPPKRGELEKEFRTNPFSEIKEGIITTLFAVSGEAVTGTCWFVYDDNGLPVYEETECKYYDTERLMGRIPDIFHSYISYRDLIKTVSEAEKIVKNTDKYEKQNKSVEPTYDAPDINPLLSGSYKLADIPNFLTFWQVVADELPKKKPLAKKMKKEVERFVSHAFIVRITCEVWKSLKWKAENDSKFAISDFIKEMGTVMDSDDEQRKADFIRDTVFKHSLSANSIALDAGKLGIPDDISGLVE